MLKLEAVGLKEAAYWMPSELSGGMARRAALARTISLDPQRIICAESFVGQDPMNLSILVKLIRALKHTLDMTCIRVSHNVIEVFSIVDYAYIVADQHVIAESSPEQLKNNPNPHIRAFLYGISETEIPLNTLKLDRIFMFIIESASSLWRKWIDACSTLGRAGCMLLNIVFGKPEPRKNLPILIKQLYRIGVQSILIIVISGLFISMVLGLQGYLTLTIYSEEGSLGMLVALSLFRELELGPVVSALLFAGRAGAALTAKISLMQATEQLPSLEIMAINPLRRVIAPAC